jgi:hypothetical protein
VRLKSSALRTSYGFSAGGLRSRSLTSTANSGLKGADDVIEFGLSGGNVPCCKLCFDLGEPNLRIRRPERGQFDADGSHGRCGSSASFNFCHFDVGVTNVGDYMSDVGGNTQRQSRGRENNHVETSLVLKLRLKLMLH